MRELVQAIEAMYLYPPPPLASGHLCDKTSLKVRSLLCYNAQTLNKYLLHCLKMLRFYEKWVILNTKWFEKRQGDHEAVLFKPLFSLLDSLQNTENGGILPLYLAF